MSKGNKAVKYEYVGPMMTTESAKEILNHIIDSNLDIIQIEGTELKKSVPCFWGTHGIGKTAFIEQVAKERGIGFSKISPAQFEEMGDLMGMPGVGSYVIKDGQSKLVSEKLVAAYINKGWERDITKVSVSINEAPEWVPNPDLGAPEIGIFAMDDFNRGNTRIMNGCMDLMQNGGLAGWKLPKGWTVVMTANPSGGTYQTTELDEAQMTRMEHFSLSFEPKIWAKWANKNGIDGRIINFVLKYPDLIEQGERTVPRTIERFSNNVKRIKDLKGNLGLVLNLAKASLDEAAATAFTTFVNDNLVDLLTPEEILNSKNFDAEVKTGFIEKFSKCTPARVDILSIVCTRVLYYCLDTLNGDLTPEQTKNLKSFIKIDSLSNDLRLDLAQNLVKDNNKLKSIMADPEVGKLLLKKM